MSRLLLTFPMTLLALSGQAEPELAECEARAARVVEQLEREAAAPLSRQEGRLAYQAALASCQGEYEPPAPAEADAARTSANAEALEAEEEPSRWDRFVAGLFTMDTQMAKKRPAGGGKYRYLEKD